MMTRRARALTSRMVAALALLALAGCAPDLAPRAKTQPDGGPSQQWTDPPPGSGPAPAIGVDAGAAAAAAPGAKSCAQIDDCYQTCADGDQGCLDTCLKQGTAQAQAQMNALDQCDQQASQGACKAQCASESQACWDCLDKACAAQATACFGASAPSGSAPTGGAGSKTCAQIAECYDGCAQTNQSCFDTCFKQGTPQAQTQMDALEQCDSNASSGACKAQCASETQACWDCLDKACAAQVTACFGA